MSNANSGSLRNTASIILTLSARSPSPPSVQALSGCACASNALSLASTSTSYFYIDAPLEETFAFPLAIIFTNSSLIYQSNKACFEVPALSLDIFPIPVSSVSSNS